MASRAFVPTRDTGESDKSIIITLASSGKPGDVFSYEQLTSALATGTDRTISKSAIYAAIRMATPIIERKFKRTLAVVPGIGYRMAEASEHMKLCGQRESKARKQVRRGLHIIENVRWDELDENTKALHRGQLLIMQGVAAAIDATNSRVAQLENMVEALKAAVNPDMKAAS